MSGYDVSGEYDCANQCRNREGCVWYTYHTENKHCTWLQTCTDFDYIGCPNCVSSHKACPLKEPDAIDLESAKGCYSPGQCMNSDLIVEMNVEDLKGCMSSCQMTPSCRYFTYYEDGKFCQQFKNCNQFSALFCENCFSARSTCSGKLQETILCNTFIQRLTSHCVPIH